MSYLKSVTVNMHDFWNLGLASNIQTWFYLSRPYYYNGWNLLVSIHAAYGKVDTAALLHYSDKMLLKKVLVK